MLKLLANENVPLDVVQALRAAGHDTAWIRIEAPGLSDLDVLARAQRQLRILLTFDKDFGELVFRFRVPAECGVILVRVRPTSPKRLSDRVAAALQMRTDWAGHFSVFDDDRIRMTALDKHSVKPSPDELVGMTGPHDLIYVYRNPRNPPPALVSDHKISRDSPEISDGAKAIIRRAEEEARSRRHEFIGTEHLLLAFAQDSNTISGRVLNSLGVTPSTLVQSVTKFVRDGTVRVRPGALPLTPRLSHCLIVAVRLAERAKLAQAEPQHILLALLEDRDGLAIQLLQAAGVEPDRVRQAILEASKPKT